MFVELICVCVCVSGFVYVHLQACLSVHSAIMKCPLTKQHFSVLCGWIVITLSAPGILSHLYHLHILPHHLSISVLNPPLHLLIYALRFSCDIFPFPCFTVSVPLDLFLPCSFFAFPSNFVFLFRSVLFMYCLTSVLFCCLPTLSVAPFLPLPSSLPFRISFCPPSFRIFSRCLSVRR